MVSQLAIKGNLSLFWTNFDYMGFRFTSCTSDLLEYTITDTTAFEIIFQLVTPGKSF